MKSSHLWQVTTLSFLSLLPQGTSTVSDKSGEEISIRWRIVLPAAGCDMGVPRANMALPANGGAIASCVGNAIQDKLPSRVPSGGEQTEAEYGTTIVLSASPEKIQIASDSRATYLTRSGRIDHFQDEACKIIALDSQMLFAVAGMAETNRRLPEGIYFDSRDLARLAANSSERGSSLFGSERTLEVAERWGWDVDFRIRRGLENGSFSAAPTFLEGIFAGAESSGELSVAIASLHYGKPIQGLIVPPVSFQIEVYKPEKAITWIEVRGIKDVAEKYISSRLQSDETKQEFDAIRKQQLGDPQKFASDVLVRLVQHTSERYPNYVNGPVDVASISRSSTVQWIERKPSCAALWDQSLKHKD